MQCAVYKEENIKSIQGESFIFKSILMKREMKYKQNSQN